LHVFVEELARYFLDRPLPIKLFVFIEAGYTFDIVTIPEIAQVELNDMIGINIAAT
jgi:hypothetical protein